MIDIEEAKRTAAYLEKMRNRRRFYINREDYDGGAQLKSVIEYFVSAFRTPRSSQLSTQFTDELTERGFDPIRVHELYDAACDENGIPGIFDEKPRDPNIPTNWPDGFHHDRIDVCLLEGTKSIRIGPWIEALANVADESNRHIGILVRFLGDDKKWAEHVIESDHLSSDGSKMFQSLEEAGYHIAGERKARAALRHLIQDSEIRSNKTIVRYSRPGWHRDEFVLPTGITTSGNKAFVAGGVRAEYGGTYEEWCEHVRDQIWTGDTPQFAIGMLAGLSGIISSRLACDHPVVYFTGPMGSGKTTSQIIGAGTVANPDEGRGTLFGVADQIDIHRGLGTCVHIDDPTKRPSLASAKKIESLIYCLHERTASTISSVSTLERLIDKAKGTMSEGVRRRVLTIDTGLIERIDIGRAMAIKSAARRYYGHAAGIFAKNVDGIDSLHERVRECTSLFAGETNDPELYGIAWIAGTLLSAAQIGANCDLVSGGGAEQIFPVLREAVDDWIARRKEGSGLAVIEGLVSEARPLGECLEGQVWIGQERDGEGGGARVLYVRTDRLDRGQVRQIKAAGKLLELNDNNTAHNYLPRPDGRFVRHYRVRSMAAGQPS